MAFLFFFRLFLWNFFFLNHQTSFCLTSRCFQILPFDPYIIGSHTCGIKRKSHVTIINCVRYNKNFRFYTIWLVLLPFFPSFFVFVVIEKFSKISKHVITIGARLFTCLSMISTMRFLIELALMIDFFKKRSDNLIWFDIN